MFYRVSVNTLKTEQTLPNYTLRKYAYSNILKNTLPKTESYRVKILMFFHISAQNINCGYSLDGLKCVPFNNEAVLTSSHNLCFEQKCEKYQNFLSENFQLFWMVKFSIYLNRCVFVMGNVHSAKPV